MAKVVPIQKPGRSEQEVGTPANFLSAVRNKFDYILGEYGTTYIDGQAVKVEKPFEFAYDLAASDDNYVVKPYFTEEDDSLIQPWHQIKGVCWLNPPYGDITPWVQKCVNETKKRAQILCLVPASTGSNWWRDYVDRKCLVYLLNGRLTFVGHTSPYPKDLALLYYTAAYVGGEDSHYIVWNWKRDI